jgi:hypothetical protein
LVVGLTSRWPQYWHNARSKEEPWTLHKVEFSLGRHSDVLLRLTVIVSMYGRLRDGYTVLLEISSPAALSHAPMLCLQHTHQLVPAPASVLVPSPMTMVTSVADLDLRQDSQPESAPPHALELEQVLVILLVSKPMAA